MSKTGFSLSTTTERLEKIDLYITKTKHDDRASFINASIDKFIELFENNMLIDFMYYIGVSLFLFLICGGITIWMPNVYFLLVTCFAGFYLIIFLFLFYNKYRGIKWHKE